MAAAAAELPLSRVDFGRCPIFEDGGGGGGCSEADLEFAAAAVHLSLSLSLLSPAALHSCPHTHRSGHHATIVVCRLFLLAVRAAAATAAQASVVSHSHANSTSVATTAAAFCLRVNGYISRATTAAADVAEILHSRRRTRHGSGGGVGNYGAIQWALWSSCFPWDNE